MKSKLLSAFFAVGLMAFGAQVNAQECDASKQIEAVSGIQASISAGGLTAPVIHSLCKKGSAKESKFSLRSGEGNLAKIAVFAALGEYLCAQDNIEEYNDSKFHKIAQETLAGQKPEDVLKKAVADAASFVQQGVCNHKDKLPEKLKILASACPATPGK